MFTIIKDAINIGLSSAALSSSISRTPCAVDILTISKPFSPKILVARVNAVLRRAGKADAADVLEVGGIKVDKTAHQVFIDGEPIELSFKEFELLQYFVENVGIALSREKILNAVWNYDYYGDARTIDTHVKKLRSKMGSKGEYIRTIWGMGYKFDPNGDTKKA